MEELHAAVEYQVLIAALVLVLVYILIIFEVVHRTIAAMFGAFSVLAVLSNLRARPSFEEVLTWIDWETCGLLFGMMLMVLSSQLHFIPMRAASLCLSFFPFPSVYFRRKPLYPLSVFLSLMLFMLFTFHIVQVGIFSTTGFFQFSAVRIYKFSRGNLWRLVAMLCVFTAIVSAFLDNVTTILLITPVTIQLCQVLGAHMVHSQKPDKAHSLFNPSADVDPVPIIVSLVLLSNVGGTATAIGDPPNILIVADGRIATHESGSITFGSMTVHLFPGLLLL